MSESNDLLKDDNGRPEETKDKQIEDLRSELAFYKSRCELLQTWQSRMRDPERTIVCDILANGMTLPDPKGVRYGRAGG